MANNRSSNTFYIDTQFGAANDGSELIVANIMVPYIIVTTSNATNQLVLADSTTGAKKISIKIPTTNTTQVIDLRNYPAVFQNGIRPVTVTACVATCIVVESRG